MGYGNYTGGSGVGSIYDMLGIRNYGSGGFKDYGGNAVNPGDVSGQLGQWNQWNQGGNANGKNPMQDWYKYYSGMGLSRTDKGWRQGNQDVGVGDVAKIWGDWFKNWTPSGGSYGGYMR